MRAVKVRRRLQEAKYLAWCLNYAGTDALRTGATMGLLSQPAPGDSDAHRLPITTPRADALRQLNAHWGRALKRRVLMSGFDPFLPLGSRFRDDWSPSGPRLRAMLWAL